MFLLKSKIKRKERFWHETNKDRRLLHKDEPTLANRENRPNGIVLLRKNEVPKRALSEKD